MNPRVSVVLLNLVESARTETADRKEQPSMVSRLSGLPVKEAHAAVFKALSDPTRLTMLRLIGSASEFACTTLEGELPISKSTISYHIKILNQADLVTVRRQGRFFFYSLRTDTLDAYAPQLVARLESDEPVTLTSA